MISSLLARGIGFGGIAFLVTGGLSTGIYGGPSVGPGVTQYRLFTIMPSATITVVRYGHVWHGTAEGFQPTVYRDVWHGVSLAA